MSKFKTDPLLLAAKVIVWCGIGLATFVAAMLTIGLGAMLTVARGEIAAEFAKINAPDSAYWAILGALVLLIAVMAIGAVFFYTLFEIVRSVDKGDPFDPANARRLAKMGWLSVAAQVLTVPLGAVALWAEKILPDGDHGFDADFGFGGGGVVLTLVLFILARVFRQGAAMREDLEGTV